MDLAAALAVFESRAPDSGDYRLGPGDVIDIKIVGQSDYRLNPGDVLDLKAFGHTELDAQHTMGPDGRISIPLVGELKLQGLTREKARELIIRSWREFYPDLVVSLRVDSYSTSLDAKHTLGPDGQITLALVGELKLEGLTRGEARTLLSEAWASSHPDLEVSLSVDAYNSNKVSVLGSVTNPGMYGMTARPKLLHALSLAGGPAADTAGNLPSLCTILRGEDLLLKLDLNQLYEDANPAMNIPLRAGDVVVVSPGDPRKIYVLGSVTRPGILTFQAGMNLVDAIALAGGTSAGGDRTQIQVLRPGAGEIARVNLGNYLRTGQGTMPELASGDILYVPKTNLAEFGYLISQIAPAIQVFVVRGAFSSNN